MGKKISLSAALSERSEAIKAGKIQPAKCFIGFDGFTDEIVQAVNQRKGECDYTLFPTIASLGQRIVEAAGKSCNIELIPKRTKLGGNAPIMTNALLSGHHEITFCGPIGTQESIEPLFREMAAGCKQVIPLGPSAHSDAIEFQDGKVILGKLAALGSVHYEAILEQAGKENLIQLLDHADLFVCANWTMLPMMNELWERLLTEIVPHFKVKKQRNLFVDLADPAKRTDEDLIKALGLLKKLGRYFNVYLGLNEAEAHRILQVLSQSEDRLSPQEVARKICDLSQLHCIVVHAIHLAAAATAGEVCFVQGPDVGIPKITTGGGDNFNAGFCNALLYQLSLEECLLSGVATSGFYVSRGYSPQIPELAAFLRRWEEAGDAQTILC